VDRVPEADDSVRALLVDEAAALPVALLGRWLRGHGRVALATTVHGYEGTGRGFELRLRGLLDRLTPDWRRVELADPIRFAAGDPLEALQFALLALDADPVPPDPAAAPVAQVIPSTTLAGDETALRALFGLLVSAHYQTRPSDLVRMLDDPAMRVWHLGPPRAPLACALTIDEGGLDPDLAADMAAGIRQPRGQQGPGVLARRLGLEAGAMVRSVRISRITVHPQVRRRGLGRQLVDAIAADGRNRGAALLSSNFGATPDLIDFWWRADCAPVRLGLTREAASGEHSAFVLRGLDAEGEKLREQAREAFAAEFPDQLGDALDGIEPPLARALLTAVDAPAPPLATDRERAARWVRGEQPLEACPGALRRLLLARLCGTEADPDPELDALVMRVLQRRAWSEVAAALGVDGRAAAEDRLRRAAPTAAPTES
jgi:tRNA(Met) cytidine acetyltransferase